MLIIIPNNVWTDVQAAKSLQQTNVKMSSYSGHEIPVVGEAKVQVLYGDQQACLPVIVSAGDGPALMGQSWLSVLKLNGSRSNRFPWNRVTKLRKKKRVTKLRIWFLSMHHCLMEV